MAYRGSSGIALPFHDHGTRRRWGVSVTPRLLFTPGKDPVPIVQEAGWAPGPAGAENLPPTGIRSLDRPARSQSLYRLSYLAHKGLWGEKIKFHLFLSLVLDGAECTALCRSCIVPRRESSVHGECEVEWAAELVWTLLSRKQSNPWFFSHTAYCIGTVLTGICFS